MRYGVLQNKASPLLRSSVGLLQFSDLLRLVQGLGLGLDRVIAKVSNSSWSSWQLLGSAGELWYVFRLALRGRFSQRHPFAVLCEEQLSTESDTHEAMLHV